MPRPAPRRARQADRESPVPPAFWALPGRVRRVAIASLVLAGLSLTIAVPAHPSFAQSPAPTAGDKDGASGGKAKMLVEASELDQNDNDHTVSAVGNVRIYYKGKTLEADKVIYNKITKRLFAVGHAKLTEPDGTVYHGDTFDLTDDFKEGFVNSLRSDSPPGPNAVHFSAPRMERVNEDTSVFTKGTYTACESCKNDPSKPPLWQIRAKRIIHKNDEKMVYYEDAYLEFLGIPVAYLPFMSAPDPSVTKKSGLLTPSVVYHTQTGYGAGIPIFWNLAPNYDLTFTPTYYNIQGFFGAGEFRQRFDNGSYYIRASGIDQAKPKEFSAAPFGGGNERFRYDVASKGDFQLSDKWSFGWNILALSDKFYLQDYAVPADTMSSNYLSESISTIYLTGQGDRSYFDLRGFYIQALDPQDIQAQQPVAAPVIDYNRTFDIDPAKTHGIGGQVETDFNFTNLSASSASFQSTGVRTVDSVFGLYNVCSVYQPGSCLLRGIAGDESRLTGQISYERKYIDPLGQVWTPFAFLRASGQSLQLNENGLYSFSATAPNANSNGIVTTYPTTAAALAAANAAAYTNASQAAFLPGGSGTTGYIVPGVGLEYRYPFMTRVPFGTFVAEPIGQIIARPDRVIGTNTLVNLDAQSLVFDTGNLFDWNKYSGYDRFETGLRANYGGQLSYNLNSGGYARFVIGQSAQLAGQNSYATPDAANIGLSSGLDTRYSDYVTGLTFSPAPFLSVGGQGRFDVSTLENRRVDAVLNLNFGKLTGSMNFANYEAQPLIGYYVRREGMALSGRYEFIEHYFVNGNVTFDMSRHLYPPALIGNSNPGTYYIAGLGAGIGYNDDCTTFTIAYNQSEQLNAGGTYTPYSTVVATLQLRTLGDASFTRSYQPQVSTQSIDAVK